ncbi:MAG TPA: hypothetical protein VE032_05045 [Actinomycetota bacterium]|nr:hypothetical protein [Actinomycetota bacterium]
MTGARRRHGPRRDVVMAWLLGAAVVVGVAPIHGLAAEPPGGDIVVTIDSGSRGALPQAAHVTYRVRVTNTGSAEVTEIALEQELPRGVAPLGSPAMGGDAGCLILGSQGPDGMTRFLASCEIATLAAHATASMVVRVRVDRDTCGDLPTTARATVDGRRVAADGLEDRVRCVCGIRMDRRVVTAAPAAGSRAVVRTILRNPGPHALQFELMAGGRRTAAGMLPGGASRLVRTVVQPTGDVMRDTVRVRAEAPDGRSCGATGTVVVRAAGNPTDPSGAGGGPDGGGTAFTGPPGTAPVAGAALASLLLGVLSLVVARRRRA